MFNINNIVRENIKVLTPYSSARDEFKGNEGVFLDANENPFNNPYNRYPDPLQREVKEKLASIKGVRPEQIFFGNGSDEAIDLLMRAFCEPHRDNIISIHPSYGMYQVAADINAVEFVKVPLNEDFTLNAGAIRSAVNANTKLIMLCSPNNPTANSFSLNEMLTLADGFDGLLVVDEAYIDFSALPSLVSELDNHPNLVILQTFSKAWGLAGLRMGIAYASEEIISILNKIKYPYNVNIMTQKLVLDALEDVDEKEEWVKEILGQRQFLIEAFQNMPLIQKIYPTDANFILVKVPDAKAAYDHLIEQKIIIRDRSKVAMCEGCLRITVGTETENKALIKALKKFDK
ncbi:MAG: histidinol-phosphate transaminase [Bacteroidota bacterium]|nr:histidinol-phosphate transaminase [Bacteroidota bacterium]